MEAWGDGVAYAAKAFLCRAMARLAYEEGMHLDVASGGELHVALSAGVPAERLVLHGNNKSEEELATALERGVGRIVVDSFDEIARLGRLLDTPRGGPTDPASWSGSPRASRPTPTSSSAPGERTPSSASRSPRARPPQAVAALELLPSVELVGVHAHIGSQVFDVSSFEQAAEVLGRFFAPLGLPELVVGGGLGVPYVNGERRRPRPSGPPPPAPRAPALGVDPSVRISAEPGRSIVAAAGMTLYTVGTVKKLPGIRTYVSVDGGMSDNPRPVLYGSGYEAFLPRAVGRGAARRHPVGGQALRERGSRRPRGLRARGSQGGRHRRHAGHGRVRLCHGVQLQQGAAAGRGLRGRRERARVVVRRETLDDMTRLDA